MPTFSLIAFVVCDEIRREATGKEILIGVYADAMVVPRFPATLRQLVFRVTVKITDPNAATLNFRIVDTEGVTKATVEAPLPDSITHNFATFGFTIEGFHFEKPTLLQPFFGINDEEAALAALAVRTATSEQERSQLKHIA